MDSDAFQTLQPQERMRHDYTCELELKSLAIREKNSKLNNFDTKHNRRINELIKVYMKLNNTKDQKSKNLQQKLKERIVKLSEITNVDRVSHEKFGEIVLLMIKNILRKPNFSGYTWRDDFYSYATYRVLRYINNFDHTKLSQRTNLPVNAFSYISQIIHNSIIFIINENNKQQEELEKLSDDESREYNLEVSQNGKNKNRLSDRASLVDYFTITEQDIQSTLYDTLKDFKIYNKTIFYYPKSYTITYQEFDMLKTLEGFDLISLIKQSEDPVVEEVEQEDFDYFSDF